MSAGDDAVLKPSDSRFDEFRALLDGRLDEAAAARLRGRMEKDPALAAEFADYAEVHAATASTTDAVPPSRLSFERLDAARRRQRVRRLRPWIGIAAGLVAAAAGVAAWRASTSTASHEPDVAVAPTETTPMPTGPRPVVLKTIRLADAVAAAQAQDFSEPPARLEDFRAVEAGRIRWIASVDDAFQMARWTARPVLVWVCMNGCPVCADLDQRGFQDKQVVSATDRFVPLRLEILAASTPNELKQKAGSCGAWPYMAAYAPDRKEVAQFSGSVEPAELRSGIDGSFEAYAQHGAAAPLAWDVANELTVKLAQASDAWKAGRAAEAWAAWDDAARRGGVSPFGQVGKDGVRRVAAEAATALAKAKEQSATDEKAGARSLSEAAERFRGTPYGLDLAEVEQELRATGRFPVIEEAAK